MDKKLDCCVVRDLLPAYIEDLTEEETAAQVREHLEDCGACQSLERDMLSQVPVEKAPKGALNFLKRVKRTRLIAAGVTLVLTLWCIWLSAPVIKCKKTPRKKCSFVAEVRKKR